MAVELTQEDLEFLLDLVTSEDLRDSSGLGNNIDNPTWGAADQPFIRLTAPSYTDGASTPRETTNTPREISDILVNQDLDGDGIEENIPNEFGSNAFLTFFGQYFDHGLDFVPKGEPAPAAIGSSSFPITASRANIIPGTGIDPDGIPNNGDEIAAQHINKTSPYVDQNQAYGSHEELTNLLRRWEVDETGNAVQSAYLLSGDLDDTGRALLPTLNDIRENYRIMTGGDELTSADIFNYRGTGQPILIDFIPAFKQNGELDLDAIGHYYVAGDGRANENVMLTSIHTIWARNHNFWVEELREKTGGAWTEEQYFQAARVINVAEYQRVVFTEFADAMAGGISGSGTHGFSGYDPGIDPSISAEFAHVAYRFGHSMLNETVSYVDKATGQLDEISLVDAFLSPQNVSEIGIANLIQGATSVEHQAIDVHMVNALRNQLVGRPLDLAALNIFRGRDTGVGTLNEVRAQLFAKTGESDLRPYENWEDFQDRNDLSNELMDKLKAAYPEGFEAVDLWVGGLLERARDGQLGSTFAWIFLDQLDRLQEGDRFYYLEQLDDADFRDQINDQTFSEIIARNTGLTNLPEKIFEATPISSEPPVDTPADPPVTGPSDSVDEIVGTADNDVIAAQDGNDTVDGGEGHDEIGGGDGHDALSGGAGNDHLNGGAGNDELHGGTGNDELHGGSDNDELYGDAGNDELYGNDGHDALHGGADHDHLDGGAGNDELYGGDGHDELVGGNGHDELFGDAGDDSLEGGSGDDMLDGGEGADTAIFADIRANYDVTTDPDGTTIVTHLNGGGDGTDTLKNIEQLQFSDQSIVTPPPVPGQVVIEDQTPEDGTLKAEESKELTAKVQLLVNPDGISEIRYQWQSSANGKNWTPIPGAKNERFTPRQSENGFSLRVALTYIFIDSAFSAVTDYSEPTPAVSPAPSDGDSPGQGGGMPNDDASGGSGDDTANGGQDDDCMDDNASQGSAGSNDDNPTSDIPANANVTYGNAGNNKLFGTRGDNIVMAEGGKDSVFGKRGDDIIFGGDGNDMLFGGKGDDIIYGGAGDDKIFGGEGDDTLFGDEGDDTLSAGSGDDAAYGGDGDDILSGGAGDDILEGGCGDDLLKGGSGDDILAGGAGNDILYGGAGHDLFIYRYGDGSDSIMDFEDDYDELEIDCDDEEKFTVSEIDYGKQYVFDNGSTLTVHSNSGKGSYKGGSDKDDDDPQTKESDHQSSENSGKVSYEAEPGSDDRNVQNKGPDQNSSEDSGKGSYDTDYGRDCGDGSKNDTGSGKYDQFADNYDWDDEFDYSDFGKQPERYDHMFANKSGDDDWPELVACGVIETFVADQGPSECVGDYASLSEMYDDIGLINLLGVTTTLISQEDCNLIC